MPELPEMENYRRIFNERLAGQRITKTEVTREKTVNLLLPQFASELQNSALTTVERRAKHLIFRLDSGKSLLLHLMLGGWMYIGGGEDSPDRTKQVTLSFGNQELYFIGLRLGYLHLLTQDQLDEQLADLGPEPLSPGFTKEKFRALLSNRRSMLKTLLVNQKFVSGIGNLYSDEICFNARLHPTRPVNKLSGEEISALYESIISVLERGISLGGYMDESVFKGDELTGSYNNNCYVYDREGEPCIRCSAPLIKDEISSRKTFYCRNCQN
ncbi:bifunctional DNA-formamidopyrimidine glycosylase/DNA-(apurinic or apyrimidinic site) lyase [Evansella clarkii]|uniref:bifunctional DNA-formamidopyrimidine glycosylase/DNA-(apurinic or apyrimidinic site) lyase n=1 Tax=Evansella clarkii TaxID=79879 RepID=UPI000B4430ED|nr:bifunctional DNA-formamidopyrimidine glycosylase/DNA-(apurinic or apyrimidinic site) lyase [Evansella clarkii]